jgi:hypothetical protein
MATALASVRYWGLARDKSKPITFLSPDHPQYSYYLSHPVALRDDVALCDKLEITTSDPPMVIMQQYHWSERKILRTIWDNDLCDQHTAVEDMPAEWSNPDDRWEAIKEPPVEAVEHVRKVKEKLAEEIAIPKELIK